MRHSLSVLVLLGVAVAGCSSDGDKKKDDPKPRPQAIASADSSSDAAVSSETASAQPAGEQPAQPAGEQPAQPAAEAPKPGPNELPFNTHANASAGDWYCALVRAHYDGKTPQGALPPTSVWCWTASPETDAEKAVVAFDTKPAIPDFPNTRTWSKKGFTKGEDFFLADKPEDITDWKQEDEKKTVGDREFDCKKITCKVATAEIVVWLSSDVPLTGIVAMTRRTDLGSGNAEVIEMEVGGFNAASPQANWGKSADDLAKDAK